MLILWTYLNLSFQCWGAFAVTFHSAITNCATKNTLECVSWHINAGVTLKLAPRSGTGGHRVYEHSTLEKNAKRFSTMVISFPPAIHVCSCWSIFSPTLGIFSLHFCQSHCGSDLHFRVLMKLSIFSCIYWLRGFSPEWKRLFLSLVHFST